MLYTLIALALAPGVAIMLFIYWRDTHDREPMRHLFICLILGMLSVIPAMYIEQLLIRNVQNYFLKPGRLPESCLKPILLRPLWKS